MANEMSQVDLGETTEWTYSSNPLFPELRVRHPKSGKLYGALIFHQFGPADEAGQVYGPDDVQGVEVMEAWSGGGRAKVTFAGGATKETIFGRRKPGAKGVKKHGTGGFNHRRQRNWRAARCNESA